MSVILSTLKKTPYLLLTLVLTGVFFAVYTLFDLRQGGTHLTIFSLHFEPFQYFVSRFGWGYVLGRVLLNICISLLSALLLAFTLDSYRGGNAVFTGSACSTGATLLLAYLPLVAHRVSSLLPGHLVRFLRPARCRSLASSLNCSPC